MSVSEIRNYARRVSGGGAILGRADATKIDAFQIVGDFVPRIPLHLLLIVRGHKMSEPRVAQK